LLTRLRQGNTANVRFNDAQRLVEALGFELDRTRGSHHIYRHATHGVSVLPGRFQPRVLGLKDFAESIHWVVSKGGAVLEVRDIRTFRTTG
jgi:predicted RNA binding protein YcfA (HicA-like mRNA interferase family)